ncbi:unnamed protein product, partial [Meganyctiphanes norvegica]
DNQFYDTINKSDLHSESEIKSVPLKSITNIPFNNVIVLKKDYQVPNMPILQENEKEKNEVNEHGRENIQKQTNTEKTLPLFVQPNRISMQPNSFSLPMTPQTPSQSLQQRHSPTNSLNINVSSMKDCTQLQNSNLVDKPKMTQPNNSSMQSPMVLGTCQQPPHHQPQVSQQAHLSHNQAKVLEQRQSLKIKFSLKDIKQYEHMQLDDSEDDGDEDMETEDESSADDEREDDAHVAEQVEVQVEGNRNNELAAMDNNGPYDLTMRRCWRPW